MEKTKFIKIGEKILFRQNTEGLNYDLENNKVYSISVNRYNDEISLTLEKNLQLPDKIYSTISDEKFVNKTLNSYEKLSKGTLGIMLSGLKGSGKTVLAKIIANKSNLPIITIDKYIHPKTLNKVLRDLGDVEVCILFDEVDKNGEDYDDDYLLRVLDGLNTNGKNMMIFTANDGNEINEYMKDRCSRIRYWREFDEMPISLITAILEDMLDNKENVIPLTDFIKETFSCISFDNVISFVNEVNNNPNDTFDDLFADMNLSKK